MHVQPWIFSLLIAHMLLLTLAVHMIILPIHVFPPAISSIWVQGGGGSLHNQAIPGEDMEIHNFEAMFLVS